MTPVFPSTLPGVKTFSFKPAPNVLASDGIGDPKAFRLLSRYRGGTASISWQFLETDYSIFRNFWVNDLALGNRWFIMSLPSESGIVTHLVKFAHGGQPQQRKNGYRAYQVSATIEIREQFAIPVSNMSAWWEFEDNNAGLQFLDETPNENHLTTSLASSALSVAGIFSRAHYRGGAGSTYSARSIYVPRSNKALDYGAADSFSIGIWIEPKASQSDNWTHVIMGRFGGHSTSADPNGLPVDVSQGSYYIGTFNGQIAFGIFKSDAERYVITLGPTAAVGTKQFILGVCDVSAKKIRGYLNGTPKGSLDIPSGPFKDGDANFALGHSMRGDDNANEPFDSTYRQFNGYIDKAFATHYACTDENASFLYNAGSGRTYTEALNAGIMVD